MLYNGIKNEITFLAKYVYIYEKVIKDYKTLTDFASIFPDAKDYFDSNLKQNISQSLDPAKDSQTVRRNKKNVTFRFNRGGSCLISNFCRHLRNSISHAHLTRKDKKLYIKDCYRDRNTSIGYLEFNYVKEFILKVIQKYENDMQQIVSTNI